MRIASLAFRDEPARIRLGRLDRLLAQLEELNLADMNRVPKNVVVALENAGVRDPEVSSVTQLIDTVFDLQEPVLKAITTRARIR